MHGGRSHYAGTSAILIFHLPQQFRGFFNNSGFTSPRRYQPGYLDQTGSRHDRRSDAGVRMAASISRAAPRLGSRSPCRTSIHPQSPPNSAASTSTARQREADCWAIGPSRSAATPGVRTVRGCSRPTQSRACPGTAVRIGCARLVCQRRDHAVRGATPTCSRPRSIFRFKT